MYFEWTKTKRFCIKCNRVLYFCITLWVSDFFLGCCVSDRSASSSSWYYQPLCWIYCQGFPWLNYLCETSFLMISILVFMYKANSMFMVIGCWNSDIIVTIKPASSIMAPMLIPLLFEWVNMSMGVFFCLVAWNFLLLLRFVNFLKPVGKAYALKLLVFDRRGSAVSIVFTKFQGERIDKKTLSTCT